MPPISAPITTIGNTGSPPGARCALRAERASPLGVSRDRGPLPVETVDAVVVEGTSPVRAVEPPAPRTFAVAAGDAAPCPPDVGPLPGGCVAPVGPGASTAGGDVVTGAPEPGDPPPPGLPPPLPPAFGTGVTPGQAAARRRQA